MPEQVEPEQIVDCSQWKSMYVFSVFYQNKDPTLLPWLVLQSHSTIFLCSSIDQMGNKQKNIQEFCLFYVTIRQIQDFSCKIFSMSQLVLWLMSQVGGISCLPVIACQGWNPQSSWELCHCTFLYTLYCCPFFCLCACYTVGHFFLSSVYSVRLVCLNVGHHSVVISNPAFSTQQGAC